MMNKEKIDFGYKQVDIDDKQGMVHNVFSSVAGQYDIMNDLMSAGLHRLWKDNFVQQIPTFDGAKLLDLAGGTGDISFRYYKKARSRGHNVNIIMTDINKDMLEQGRARAIDNNYLDSSCRDSVYQDSVYQDSNHLDKNCLGNGHSKSIEFQEVDAQNIPFDDNSFDFVTISFGIRNVTDRPKALQEIFRVLKKGGKFLCLEFSHIENQLLATIYDKFSFHVIPQIGKLITGDKDSYQYLVESIRKFPSCADFATLISDAGFSQVDYQELNKSIVAIHSGVKI